MEKYKISLLFGQKKKKRILPGTMICHLADFCIERLICSNTGPQAIKLFSCSTQLRMKLVLLINLKLLIITNSLLLNIAEHENFSANYCWHFHIEHEKCFITLGPDV